MIDLHIGLWCDYEDTDIVTTGDLIDKLKYNKPRVFDFDDYFDRRKSTNLIWFNFDPYTGKPVDNKAVKRFIENQCNETDNTGKFLNQLKTKI